MKVDRLIAIIMLLLEREQLTAEELARRFEVSPRTIYRDLETISRAGIPIVAQSGPGNGIRILDTYRVEKRLFSTQEITGMLLALGNMQRNLPSSELVNAAAKIEGMVPAEQRRELDLRASQIKIDLSPWLSGGVLEKRLEAIRAALEKQRLVRFAYCNNRGQSSERQVEPYRLLLKGEDWYLQGYCLYRRAFRTFKILRMQKLSVLKDSFAMRPFPRRQMDSARFADQSLVSVTLRIHMSILDRIVARFGEDCLTKDGLEYYIAQVKLPLDELAYRYLMSFGSRCICLAPEEMKRKVHDLAAEVCRLYPEFDR